MILFLASPDPQGRTRIRALVVEDDTASRESMVRIFKMLGIEAVGAINVAEGLKALEQQPEALILDLMLPDGSGLDILRRIREAKLPIRVAVLTGADKPMIQEAEQLKPDALFTKPVDLTKLLNWLRAA